MSKIIKFDKEAKNKLQEGINKLANAVVSTLGPFGRNVIIEKNNDLPYSTKDGVTVAKSITLEDPIENIGAEILKQAAIKSANQAGDGTTTTTLLAQSLVQAGSQYSDKEFNLVEIKKGMEMASSQIINNLREISEEISSEEQLKQIARISSNNDELTGDLISTALEKVGADGIVTIEESKTGETYLETVEGMQFKRGYKSPYFVTNNDTMQAVLEDVSILLYDGRITQAKEILSLLENISQTNKSLLIIAEDIDNEALATLIVNKMRGNLKVCAVKAPDFAERRTLIMEDMAVLTGGTVISKNKGMNLGKLSLDNFKQYLGSCGSVNVSKETTTIINGMGDVEQIQARALEIKAQIDRSNSNFETEKLQDRLAKITSGVSIIHVGGANEIEMREYKDRVEDALYATKAAIEEGIIPGGGVAFLYAGLDEKSIYDKTDSRSVKIGKSLVLKAIKKPFNQILTNAGIENPDHYAWDLTKGKKIDNWKGYNLFTDKIVNMRDNGIIDPTKVTRLALENAVSVAGTILTTETVVYQKPETKEKSEQEFNLGNF